MTGPDRRNAPGRSARRPAARLGPLLAVCGLVGGVGTTNVAYLTALAAARGRTDPVLVADTGGPSGGLAACAGVEAPRSLPELATQLATGGLLRGGVYATGPAGLRVLATGPEFTSSGASESLGRLLLDAREAHRLTVIDCGQRGGDIDGMVIRAATHVAWVVSASEDAVRRGRRVLDATPRPPGKELIVARADGQDAKATVGALRRLAAGRHALLVLIPHLSGFAAERCDRATEEAQVPIQAILGALER